MAPTHGITVGWLEAIVRLIFFVAAIASLNATNGILAAIKPALNCLLFIIVSYHLSLSYDVFTFFYSLKTINLYIS